MIFVLLNFMRMLNSRVISILYDNTPMNLFTQPDPRLYDMYLRCISDLSYIFVWLFMDFEGRFKDLEQKLTQK